jgi:tRNA-dihydrouridine synthase B
MSPLVLSPPFGLAPMAGLTDSAFRRLVKRHGGCGLVVTEMISSVGLVRAMERTLKYAQYTEEERPIAVQVFGGVPETMAEAAQAVERLGADIVDVNMGCPVPKVANHEAGCGLMRTPERAAAIVAAMAGAVKIPVSVKIRAGWNEREVTAPEFARRLEDAGAAAITVHGRTAAQGYRGSCDWDLIARVADSVRIPVFGNGDCLEPEQVLGRLRTTGVSGILVGRGVLRNPWILAQSADLLAGRSVRQVMAVDRGQFLIDYIDLLINQLAVETQQAGNGHTRRKARRASGTADDAARGGERWVINKVRALSAWYTKGLVHGGHFRAAVNKAESISQVRDLVHESFFAPDADATGRSEGVADPPTPPAAGMSVTGPPDIS